MRNPHPTTLLLTVAVASLTYALARTQVRLASAHAECDDLWHEGQDERQRADLLQDDLADERQRHRQTEDELNRTLSDLGLARGEVGRAQHTSRLLMDAMRADTTRRADRQQASGWWVWTQPRNSPSGPFDDVDAGREEAEQMARLYSGQDVHLLAAVDRVRIPTVESVPVWDVRPEGA